MSAPALPCARCGRAPLSTARRQREGFVPWRRYSPARGLCRPCYKGAAADGTLDDWPRLTWRAEDLVGDAELVRATRRPAELGREFLTWPQVAEVLGVPFPTLDKARQRVSQRSRSAA